VDHAAPADLAYDGAKAVEDEGVIVTVQNDFGTVGEGIGCLHLDG
jgi:hypothetical protein